MLFSEGKQGKCEKCGRLIKFEDDFESRWTVAMLEGKTLFFCPKCWGIHDPAPGRCREVGHRWGRHGCWRCGIKEDK